MKKRIFAYMSLIILLTVALLSVLWGAVLQNRFGAQLKGGLKTLRVSIIAENGEVLFDNYADPSSLENHKDRPEVIDAIQKGHGESERISDTLGQKTYYYAVLLKDSRILRLALTTDSIYTLLYSLIPMAALCLLSVLLISFLTARKLTGKIIAPVNRLNLDGTNIDVYDELSPFIKKIELQKKEISGQLSALENHADTIKAITENMKEGLILIDENGMVLSANLSAQKILNEHHMINRNILHIYRNIDWRNNVKRCLTGGNGDMIFEVAGKTYHIYLNPVYTGGVINGAIILFLDTTEKYRAEKQRKEFSANVSHELKTPLTTISALSEMIGNGMAKNEEDIKHFALKITEQTRRLINIIDDIIRLSEFDEGELRKEYSSFDLNELTDSVLVGLQEKAREKHVEVEVLGEHLQMSANKRMLDELLYNLVENSIKYNEDGGKVTVSFCTEEGFCKISVADTGIGIPKEHQERVFERFYRVDQSRSQKTGGTGLGLSIVKHIVEHHKGRIVLESSAAGTAITCYIPCQKGQDA